MYLKRKVYLDIFTEYFGLSTGFLYRINSSSDKISSGSFFTSIKFLMQLGKFSSIGFFLRQQSLPFRNNSGKAIGEATEKSLTSSILSTTIISDTCGIESTEWGSILRFSGFKLITGRA